MSGAVRLNALLARDRLPAAQSETLAYGLFAVMPTRRDQPPMPLNLVVLVEKGQAMESERQLEWVQRALGLLGEVLGPEDALGLVVFGDRAKAVLPAEPMADPAKVKRIVSFLDSHSVGAGADMLEGLKAAAEELRKHMRPGVASRLVIISRSPVRQELEVERLGRQLAAEGVGLITLGLGYDWSGGLLARLADAGPGAVRLVPRANDMPFAMREAVEPLTKLAFTDLKLRLRLAKGVGVRRVFQVFPAIAHWLPAALSERDMLVPLGDLGVDRPCYLLVEFVAPPRESGTVRLAQADVGYAIVRPTPSVTRTESVDLTVDFGQGGPVRREVMRFVEAMQIYNMIERGIEARRGQDFLKAERFLTNAYRIAGQGGHGALAEELSAAIDSLTSADPLPERMSKQLLFLARMPEER